MKLLTATSIALVATTSGALAEAHMADYSAMSSAETLEQRDQLIRTRDITGGQIYTLNAANDEGWDGATQYDTVGTDWNEIGEIEDVILSRDGQMVGIVGEIGGFLDLGDKHVMIPVRDVSLVAVDDETYSYVTWMNEEELEALPGVDEGFWD